jgi:hypothetical protein
MKDRTKMGAVAGDTCGREEMNEGDYDYFYTT